MIWQRITDSRWLAWIDLVGALIGGAIWYVWTQIGWWPLLIALIGWVMRVLTGRFPFKRTQLDIPIGIFLLTAAGGVWAAYDRADALAKFKIIIAAVLIYYALAGQPKRNLWPVAALLAVLGTIFATIFLFGYGEGGYQADFHILNVAWTWWSSARPSISLIPLHQNVAGGVLATFLPFSLALLWFARRRNLTGLFLFAIVVIGITSIGLMFSSSRGAWLASLIAIGLWLLRTAGSRNNQRLLVPSRIAFGIILLLILTPFVFFKTLNIEVLAGIADNIPGHPSGTSRLELAWNTLHLIEDFPITGGGLASFAGLYSHYIMDIPFFLFSYSHNLFLDVGLEQGVFGLLAIVAVLLGSGWSAAHMNHSKSEDTSTVLLCEAVLAGIIVICFHGTVDDALYGHIGTPLLFVLPGMAVAVHTAHSRDDLRQRDGQEITDGSAAATGKRGKSALFIGGLLVFISMLVYKDTLQASWYANLAALQMARAELEGFPANEWNDGANLHTLQQSEAFFFHVLELDAENPTAHHRLGSIAMVGRDYGGAINHLQIANRAKPNHRGIAKRLGYSLVWTGEYDRALAFLLRVPEAHSELKVYSWWWVSQGREDLARQAAEMVALMEEVSLDSSISTSDL